MYIFIDTFSLSYASFRFRYLSASCALQTLTIHNNNKIHIGSCSEQKSTTHQIEHQNNEFNIKRTNKNTQINIYSNSEMV